MATKNSPNSEALNLRKARGAFFTPRILCDFISLWAVRSRNDKILEPSCGEANFLLSVGSLLRSCSSKSDLSSQLFGVEIHQTSSLEAQRLLADAGFQSTIVNKDFFDVPPQPIYDAVVGNPPFVRYQDFFGTARTKGLQAALAQGVRLNLLANSWAAFVVHAAQFLKPEGRLGLVLPAELLTVKYAAQVRRFLLNRFSSIKLVMFEELVFPNVLEEVVLLLAEGSGSTSGFELFQARNVEDLRAINTHSWSRYYPEGSDKWTPALIPSEALNVYRQVLDDKQVETLLDWGESSLGIVTGNNKYFTISAKQLTQHHVSREDCLAISPPGSRHLRGLTFTAKAWNELVAKDESCYLFHPKPNADSRTNDEYIKLGESAGVHQGYKCRIRKTWWRVPIVPVPDLFLTYMDHTCPRLITNEARVHHLNSLYGVKLKKDRRVLGCDLLPLASLNSLTLLGAEIIGRSYGGGILKLEPTEADRLPFPSKALLESAAEDLRVLRPQLAMALREGDIKKVIKAVDNTLLKKHLRLRPTELESLRTAREILFKRRTGRGRKSRGEN